MTKARDIATSEVVTGEIGSTIQAHDADLDSIAALDKTDGNVIVGDGTNWVAESGATARTSLGLGTAATTAATDYATAAQGTKADSALQPADIGTSVLSPTGDGSSLTGIAGGFSNLQVFTSPGTWTNPGNVTKVKVTVVGGGGGASGRGVGAGGGGGAAIEVIPFPSATNVPVTVGGGGSGTPTNVQNGSNPGGTSSFGSYCSATGGGKGYYELGPNRGPAGPGGVGSGGTLNIQGGPGVIDASGGNSIFGGAGVGWTPNTFATAGGNAGAYGGGGGTGGSNSTGGNGSAGVVVVEY